MHLLVIHSFSYIQTIGYIGENHTLKGPSIVYLNGNICSEDKEECCGGREGGAKNLKILFNLTGLGLVLFFSFLFLGLLYITFPFHLGVIYMHHSLMKAYFIFCTLSFAPALNLRAPCN